MRKLHILCRSRKLSPSVDLVSWKGRRRGASTERWSAIMTDELRETDRSKERDLTQKVFLPPQRTALQRISLPAPSPLYHKPSRSETLQRSWTRPSRPEDKVQTASEWDKQVQLLSLLPRRIPAHMISSKSPLSSHQQNGTRTNQDEVNPKRKRRIASNNNLQHGVLLESICILKHLISVQLEFSQLITLRLKMTGFAFYQLPLQAL